MVYLRIIKSILLSLSFLSLWFISEWKVNSILKMGAACFPKTLLTSYQMAWRYILGDSNVRSHNFQYFKSRRACMCSFFVSWDNQTSNHNFFQIVVRWYIWTCDSCKNRPAVYLRLLSEMCASMTCISCGH